MGLLTTKNANKKPKRRPQLMPGQGEYAFRRSRTLTGTTSSKVVTGAETNSQLKTPRLKEHELRQQQTKIVRTLLIAAVCMLLLGLIIASYIRQFAITYSQSHLQTTQPPTSSYEERLEKYFLEHPFERFGFLLNERGVEQFLKKERSEISSVGISKDWYGGNVQFSISFRQPILMWQSGSQRFYVDDQGVAFSYDHFGARLVSVTDQSGIAPDTSSSVTSRRFVHFLGKMVGAVNASDKGRVNSVIIPSSTREIDLKLEGREYPIKTHIDRDPLQQAEDIIAALSYFDKKNSKPAYIDVRVGGKAFYK